MRYVITGLPRSGTTWLSVFLTTDDCVCLHDPSATMSPKELQEWEGGVCDTGMWYYHNWCKKNSDKFVIIERDYQEVNKSLSEIMVPLVPKELATYFYSIEADYKIQFSELFKEETLRKLWKYVHPNKPFSRIRYLALKDLEINTLKGK